MNTRQLKIRLWMMTGALLLALYVFGVLFTGNGDRTAALVIVGGCCGGLIGAIVVGWLGLASYRAHQKEARRGTTHHDRP